MLLPTVQRSVELQQGCVLEQACPNSEQVGPSGGGGPFSFIRIAIAPRIALPTTLLTKSMSVTLPIEEQLALRPK